MAKPPAPKANQAKGKPAPKGKAAPKSKADVEAEAKEKADEEAATKKAAKKRMLILGGALAGGLLLGGGSVGGYFMFLHKSAVKVAPPPKETAADKKKSKADPDVAYVKLQNLSAPLLDNGKVLQYVLLDFSLEVNAGKEESNIFQHLPAIRAAFLMDVTEHPIGTPEDPTVIDYQALGNRLLDVANQAIESGGVKRVLVTQTIR